MKTYTDLVEIETPSPAASQHVECSVQNAIPQFDLKVNFV